MEKLDGFKWRGGGLGAWLFSIAHNSVMDHFRKISRTARQMSLDDGILDMLTTVRSIDEEVEISWRQKVLLNAIGMLSEEQQQVILLKTGGESGQDICREAAGQGEDTSRVQGLIAAAIARRDSIIAAFPLEQASGEESADDDDDSNSARIQAQPVAQPKPAQPQPSVGQSAAYSHDSEQEAEPVQSPSLDDEADDSSGDVRDEAGDDDDEDSSDDGDKDESEGDSKDND